MEEINPLIAAGIIWFEGERMHWDLLRYALMRQLDLREAEVELRAMFADLMPEVPVKRLVH